MQVLYFRRAPAVNALIWVTNNSDPPVSLGEKLHEVILDAVGVLVFINQDSLYIGYAGRKLLEKLDAPDQEIIIVQQVGPFQMALVGFKSLFESP